MTAQPTDRTEPGLDHLHTAAIRLHDAIAAAAATTSNPTAAGHLDDAQIAMAPVLTALRRAAATN